MPLKPPQREHTVLRLKHPIQFGSETIEEIYVRKPRTGEFGLLPVPSPGVMLKVSDTFDFTAKICGLTRAQLDLLEAADFKAVMDLSEKYQEDFQGTGETDAPSSPGTSTSGATTSSRSTPAS